MFVMTKKQKATTSPSWKTVGSPKTNKQTNKNKTRKIKTKQKPYQNKTNIFFMDNTVGLFCI